ncbi:MAG: glutamine--fructose-6-phosphate transaminase (isomerizing) [Actinomycetota bacterium]
MCGIVGYVGPEQALPIVMEGLRRLEYRGYDSAGVAVVDGGLSVVKRAGKLSELEAALDGATRLTGTTGIGHTRWATHGPPTDHNAHPHLDCSGRIAVIHNGIIENYQALRDRLAKAGHKLASDTDTEVVAHLIEDAYDGDLAQAIRATVRQLSGAYALVVSAADHPETLIGVKVSSPLIVGIGEGESLLASDVPALLERTRTYVPLEEGQMAEITPGSVRITDLDGDDVDIVPRRWEGDVATAEKASFPDFMLKEIHEQPAAVRDTLAGRINDRGWLTLDELHLSEAHLELVDKVFVVACGTAFHAGLVAKYAIEHWARIPVEIEIASEFRYRDPVLDGNTLTIGISQSGETIDTLEAIRHARAQQSRVLAITNTVASSIARESDGVLYTHAGPERAVAATKTFLTQMAGLHLLALYLAQVRGTMYPEEISEQVRLLRALPERVRRALQLEDRIKQLAARFRGVEHAYFIGRHTGYPAALEGALKLKEISYIHAEGYPAGDLKHGPIALIDAGSLVVAVATRCHVYPKMISNIQEVKARGAEVIALATEGDDDIASLADHVVHVPETPELLAPVVVSVPLQLFAYHVAKLRGCDVDQPRNLAKSVTVE